MKGKLIAIDGLDASGKGTQTKLIEQFLTGLGYDVVVYSFPNYESVTGELIAKYLRGEFGDINSISPEIIATIYSANRASHAEDISCLLENGYIVLCDRYVHSNIFNCVKYDRTKWDEFMDWVEKMEFEEFKMSRPDLTLFLHVDPKISIENIKKRGKKNFQEGKDDIHELNSKLLTDASEAYIYFANKYNWTIIDEMKNDKQMPIEDVFTQVMIKVLAIL